MTPWRCHSCLLVSSVVVCQRYYSLHEEMHEESYQMQVEQRTWKQLCDRVGFLELSIAVATEKRRPTWDRAAFFTHTNSLSSCSARAPFRNIPEYVHGAVPAWDMFLYGGQRIYTLLGSIDLKSYEKRF
jgi:hypothetical protein